MAAAAAHQGRRLCSSTSAPTTQGTAETSAHTTIFTRRSLMAGEASDRRISRGLPIWMASSGATNIQGECSKAPVMEAFMTRPSTITPSRR